jgi:hypothetical protein
LASVKCSFHDLTALLPRFLTADTARALALPIIEMTNAGPLISTGDRAPSYRIRCTLQYAIFNIERGVAVAKIHGIAAVAVSTIAGTRL